jgi:hypothetical protein
MPDNSFNMGKSAEITRDEVRFNKFVARLRQRFSALFLDLVKTQVILKGIMTEEDWNRICQDITFRFNQDSYFVEMKENDILRERLDIIAAVTPYIGQFFSKEYVRKNLLKQSEEDILQIDAEIHNEAEQDAQMQELQQMQQMQQMGMGGMDQQQGVEEQPPPEEQQPPQ